MAKARSLVGLEVHAAKIVAAVLDAETGELTFFGFSGETETAAAFCAGLPRPVRVAYEAGPTGYGLARELAKRRVECVVAAPSKIPRASGDRVKTDRRDAELLVRMLLAGKLHAVRVPGAEEGGRPRRRRCSIAGERSTSWRIAVTHSSGRSSRSSPTRHGESRSACCAACVVWTRSQRSGCAPRSATSNGSRARSS
jgi:transposase